MKKHKRFITYSCNIFMNRSKKIRFVKSHVYEKKSRDYLEDTQMARKKQGTYGNQALRKKGMILILRRKFQSTLLEYHVCYCRPFERLCLVETQCYR